MFADKREMMQCRPRTRAGDVYRFYTGKDGLSHVEEIEVKNFDQNNIANL